MTPLDPALSLAKLCDVRLRLPAARFLSLTEEQIQLCCIEAIIAYLEIQNPQAVLHNALKDTHIVKEDLVVEKKHI